MSGTAGRSLYSALALYTRLYHKPVPEDELVRGLPLAPRQSQPEVFSGGLLIDNFARAAARAGLRARLVARRLDEISPLTLPVILAMKDGSGCILDRVAPDRTRCTVVLPEGGEATREVAATALEDEYSGHCFLLGREFDHDRSLVGASPNATGEGTQSPAASQVGGHWFWGSLRSSWPIYFDVMMASVALNVFSLVSPLFTMNVYDRVVPNYAVDTLWVLGSGVMVVILFDALLKTLRAYFIEVAAKKSDIIISARLFEKVLDLRMEQAPRNVGAFAANFREFDAIRNFLTSSVMLALVDLPFTVLLLIVVQLVGGALVLIPVTMMALILIYTLLVRGAIHRSVAASYEASARKSGVIVEALGGLADIKFLNASGPFQWRWENVVAELAEKGIRSRLWSMSISTLTSVLVQLDTVLVIIAGVYLIHDQSLTMGGMIAVVMLSSRAIAPMGQVVGLLSSWEQTRVAYDTLDEIMHRPSENASAGELIKKEVLEGKIEFRDVGFTYPGTDRPAVTGISFSIGRGERVALLGRTGSGKTTIQKLVMGLFRPQQGAILVDGLDSTQLSPVLLRRNISYVPQDFMLFSGSLRDNLAIRSPHADDMALLEVARLGGLEGLIRGHPRGIEARVEERGANLSGGQRQGVAIARAFLVPSPVVLLDEPTSAMDGGTENQVKAALVQRMEGRTTILTTHKMSMLDMVDRVLVMEGGRLVFDGTRADFLTKFSTPAGGAPAPLPVTAVTGGGATVSGAAMAKISVSRPEAGTPAGPGKSARPDRSDP